jgi:hypothetical protein
MSRFQFSRYALATAVAMSPALFARDAVAQGCMPIRFVSPALGGRDDAYLERGAWRASVAFRRLYADEFFFGTRTRLDLAPGTQPILITNHTIDAGFTYAATDRISLTLNVPWTTGSISNVHRDGIRHDNDASGLGDVNVRASVWLWDQTANPRGNLALGLGVKAPTGNIRSSGTAWLANGSAVDHPASVAIQPGEGGWGIIFQGEAFRHVARNTFVYASGVYTANPRESIDVARNPGGTLLIGVPDTYSMRAGASFNLYSRSALSASSRMVVSASLGWREDATAKRDLIGGSDLAFRAPAIVGYLDNGVSLVRGRNSMSLNVPVRAYQNYRRSVADETMPLPGGKGGNLARYLILAEFSRRY